MFCRRLELSWPLIIILFGLFLLSFRMPRSWERIARDKPLALAAHKAVLTEQSAAKSAAVTRTPLEPAAFRVAQVAGPVADKVEAASNSVASVPTAPATTVVPAATAALPAPLLAPTDNERPKDVDTAIAAKPRPVPAAKPAMPLTKVETQVATAALPASADEVRVLHDGPSIPEQGPILSQEQAPASDLTFRRLPATEPATTDTERKERPSVVAEVNRPTFRTTTAEPSLTSDPNPLRGVVPEPQSIVGESPQVSPPLPSTAGRSEGKDSSDLSLRASDALAPASPSISRAEISALAPSTAPVLSPASGGKEAIAETQPVAKAPLAAAPPTATTEQPPMEAIGPMKAIGRAWEPPTYLLAQLEQLKKHPAAQGWATSVTNELHKLGPAIAVGAPETAEILRRLEGLVQQAAALAVKMDDEAVAQELNRTSSALQRRITIWKQIGQMGGMLAADFPAPAVDSHSFNKCLSDVEQLTDNGPEGHAWRKYLLIDSLREWAARRRSNEERMPHDLAQQVSKRLNQMSMTTNQRQFLTSGPLAALNREMIRHTAEPVDSNHLLQHLETYERTGLPSDGRVLARDCQFLSVGSGAAQRELGECFEVHYRNANLRLAVSAELLNRMLPKREPEYAPVVDTIQNVPVRGQSLSASDISVRMIPDPSHIRLALEVNGEVASLTRSTAGPATFYTDSESSYFARKPLEISLRGIQMWPTEVAVDNRSQLRQIATDFDRLPIFGQVARNVARTKHDEQMPAAEAEVREKIAAKARERVDQEATAEVSVAAKRLHEELLGPMDSLLLDPMLVSAETTDMRFSARIRLAGPDQLGGHTPRPQAPSDSLASVQIHESLLNNVLARLELDGQTFDLASLGRRLSERLHRFQPKPVDPDQEDVKITFAAKDAVHVRCNDGRLEITLAIARLSKGSRHFKDFQVRAFYKPVVEGRSIDLSRDGIVQLIGPRMNAGTQIVLRGVFLKLFSQKEAIHVTPESFVKNPKLDGVVVTQFVIDDGWIGAAIGPQANVASEAAATKR